MEKSYLHTLSKHCDDASLVLTICIPSACTAVQWRCQQNIKCMQRCYRCARIPAVNQLTRAKQPSSGGTPCRCCRMLLLRCPLLLLLLPLSSRPQKLPTRDEELFQMQIRDKAFFHDSSVIPDGAEISSYLFRDTPKRYFYLVQVRKLYFEDSSFICWVFWNKNWIQTRKIQMPVLSCEVNNYASFHPNLASLAEGLSNLFDFWDKPRAPTDHRSSLKWGH